MTPYPNPNMPPHLHTDIPSHPYPRIPTHPMYTCPYLTSNHIYEPYGFLHHTNIPYLGYLHLPTPNKLPFYMLPNLIPPDLRPNYSR